MDKIIWLKRVEHNIRLFMRFLLTWKYVIRLLLGWLRLWFTSISSLCQIFQRWFIFEFCRRLWYWCHSLFEGNNMFCNINTFFQNSRAYTLEVLHECHMWRLLYRQGVKFYFTKKLGLLFNKWTKSKYFFHCEKALMGRKYIIIFYLFYSTFFVSVKLYYK